jgi:hypothetical protein
MAAPPITILKAVCGKRQLSSSRKGVEPQNSTPSLLLLSVADAFMILLIDTAMVRGIRLPELVYFQQFV